MLRVAARAFAARRELPPPLKLTDRCARQLMQLLEHKKDATAVRIKMVNDWSSSTGFSFSMEFAESKEDGEEMVVQDGARVYIESQALFNTETGLLGSTLDMDDNLDITIIAPPKRDPPKSPAR